RCADGSIRNVESFSGPIDIGDRQLLYSIVHDVTERHKAEAELRKLSMAIEQSPESIMITNLEIGYLTPPVGLNLIVAMAAFKESFGTIVKAVIPFIVIMAIWLFIVVTYPPLSLTLVGN
ncbi:MAG TPA: TRAP transporter large permease subunit, partial [Quisquiliibacterium sp.]|nr:TRAP transporter large permease subunit [Quisquiliibacterium sp.]